MERRSKGAGAVFAARRKRSRADFAKILPHSAAKPPAQTEAQRSGFGLERRSKGASAVFAARRKRS